MCDVCGCGDPHKVTIDVHTSLLAKNDRDAAHLRAHFAEDGVLALNVMGSPGSGKTALIEAVARSGRDLKLAAGSGDLPRSLDAERLASAGVPSASITTGSACHLDAAMVHHALHDEQLCNIGHFDSEIQVASLKNLRWNNIKPQVDEIEFADGKRVILLSEGRLVNLGNAMGHPSFVMSASFTNKTLAQIELFGNPGAYEKKVYTLPKHLDEKVARLHLAKIGAKLTRMSQKQSTYIGVAMDGPYKPDHYRY